MKQFLYLFRGGDGMQGLSPEEMQAHMERWKTWMQTLAEEGKLEGGLPLSREGKQVKEKATVVTDGPFAAGKEVVGGYLIVNAADMDAAAELSKGCPIFESEDGNVEVRELLTLV